MRRLALGLGLGAVLTLARVAPARADVQQWTEVGVEHDVSKRVGLSFDQHLRFDDDVSRVAAFMPEPGVQYRLRKWLRFGLGYRMQYERSGSGDMRTRHRFFGNVRTRGELGEVRFEHRLQLQEQLRPDDGNAWRHTVRNRLDVSYQALKRWTPSTSVELFHAIDDGDTVHLDKVWLTVGLDHARKWHDLGVFYRAELPVAGTNEPTLHILGLGAHFEL